MVQDEEEHQGHAAVNMTRTEIKEAGADAVATSTRMPTTESPVNDASLADAVDGNTPAPAVTERDSTYSTSEVEDGSLMHFYESRLRRLRDYETRVLSRYKASNNNGSAITPNRASHDDGAVEQEELEQNGQQRLWSSGLEAPASPSGPTPIQFYQHAQIPEEADKNDRLSRVSPHELEVSTPEPPSVIDVIEVDDSENNGESLDDITLSTGIASTPVDDVLPKENTTVEAPEGPRDEEEGPGCGPKGSEEGEIGIQRPDNEHEPESIPTDYSTESSDTDMKNKGETPSGNNKADQKPDEEEGNINEPYSYMSADDSKYENYSLLVDLDQEDRAVEIALYSGARPHMRGFHLAWTSFFVAFFTWFAMTPLLKDIARSLGLTRREVWTSSTLAVAGSAVTRILIGPLNDIYGARWSMGGTLLLSAIPTAVAGLAIHNATGLYIIRLLIGVAGSAFVTCQFWTSSMFTIEVAGTANSLAAGWGNLGGGVAQVVMGSLLFPLFKVIYGGQFGGYSEDEDAKDDKLDQNDYDRPADLAWRTVMVFPAIFSIFMAYHCIRSGDDCPKGNFRKRQVQGFMPRESASDAIARAACHRNTWLLFLQYGCCFGVEITMTNAAALYFQEEFGQNTESAAAIASVFGWMNLFARGIGGFLSDMANATYGMRGRLWVQTTTLLIEGALVCAFSTTQTLAKAIVVMVIFSIFVQAAEGSTFGLVPYVDYSVTGSVAGIIGAGGNVGGVIFSLFFRSFDNRTAFLWMGILALASSFLSMLLGIQGHRSLLFGEDAEEVLARRGIRIEQLGNVPNVDLHTHNGESHRNRQSTRR